MARGLLICLFMLSYRHSFHAGNHADVLKHLSLYALLQGLSEKPKPLCYFETHAGAGRYAIDGAAARKTGEFAAGAGLLLRHPTRNALLGDYLTLIRGPDPNVAVQHYPGSPRIAQTLLRATDRMILCELHPEDHRVLQQLMARDERVAVHRRDGFEALRALLPPAESRGLVLIDPAYEVKADYADCVRAITDLRRRFRAATIALWYPRLPGDPAAVMLRSLSRLPATESLQLQLDVTDCIGDFGMYGSGMLILQPPWKLADRLRPALDEAARLLSSAPRLQIIEHPGG